MTYTTIEAKIIESRHVTSVIPLIDKDTWFLVDLDNCMFEGAQALGHSKWFSDEFKQRLEKGLSFEDSLDDLYPSWAETQKICPVKPLEEEFIPTLLSLQEKGIVIMGLTHRDRSVADSTKRQVTSLGFDFFKSAPSQESFLMVLKRPMLYKDGILFVSDFHKKDDALRELFIQIGCKPKKIVFIDDKRSNLEDLESVTADGIEYIGVHYTAIQYLQPVYDRKLAQVQRKYLDRILSNEAAQLLIDHGLD